jgi:hypothetical protein
MEAVACARLDSTELRPAEQDRRVRILKPTEKLRAHDRDWLAAHYTTLTVSTRNTIMGW